MRNQRQWILYDWFKLIVALVLIIILILLFLQPPAQTGTPQTLNKAGAGISLQATGTVAALPVEPTHGAPPAPTITTAATQPATAAPAMPAASPTPAATAIPTALPASPTPAALAASPTPAATNAPATPAVLPTPAATAVPAASAAPTQPATPTPTAPPATLTGPAAGASAADSGDCAKALSTRLNTGMQARVASNLNMRKTAGMNQPILLTNLPGATLEIIGGPVCIPYGEGVYRWWNVKTPNGTTGWSAEGSLLGKFYFLEPLP